jgi:hypothetical protein
LIVTVVATDCGNKLLDEPDIIEIFVNVKLVLIVQVAGIEFIKQEEVVENVPEAITFYDVYIVKEEPIEVEKLGVTTNYILLVADVIIDESFKG